MSLRSGSPCTSTSRPTSSWKPITRSISERMRRSYSALVDLALAKLGARLADLGRLRVGADRRGREQRQAEARVLAPRGGPRTGSSRGRPRRSAPPPARAPPGCGCAGSRAGPRAPGRWRPARSRSPRAPRRGPRASVTTSPTFCFAKAIQERSSSSSTSEGGSASRSTGVCSSEQEVETTSSAQRSRRPPSRSRLCSSSLIQTLRPSTIPANSHLSSSPPSSAISSTFLGPRAPSAGPDPLRRDGSRARCPRSGGRAARRRRRRRGRSRS